MDCPSQGASLVIRTGTLLASMIFHRFILYFQCIFVSEAYQEK